LSTDGKQLSSTVLEQWLGVLLGMALSSVQEWLLVGEGWLLGMGLLWAQEWWWGRALSSP